MADQREEEDDNDNDNEISKSFVGTIFWKIQKLAAPLLKPLGPRSRPPSIHDDDLRFLERKLERIRATLKDSDRLDTSLESVKLWLRELKELESCIEDVIEEMEFETRWKPNVARFRSQLRRTNTNKDGMKKRDEIGLLISFRPKQSLSQKIRKIENLYNEIASDREALRFKKSDGVMRPHHCPWPESTSFPAEDISYFHGRKNEFNEVMFSLFSEASDRKCVFSVIAIVGMAGVGKTTLAQHVFNHEEVNSHFDEKIWICMSKGLDVEKVTRDIRDNLMKVSCSPLEPTLDLLQKDVRNHLTGKRFLLVLDSVWNEDLWRSKWEAIQTPLKVGASGSKVIVTTRDNRFAKIMGVVHPCRLGCLSDDDCWSIFQRHSFIGQYHANPELIKLGKRITQKCKGLPLAAKVLGCLLRFKLDVECLRELLRNDMFYFDEFKDEILRVLMLSYNHLPFHLKRCFTLCSLFPKNFTFEKNQLVWLWMAQGFVEPREGLKLEDTASKYVDELEERTLVQYDPRKSRYMMHDLFQELAKFVAGDEFLITKDLKGWGAHRKTRHSSVVPHDLNIKEGIELKLTDNQDLRSLLLLSGHGNKTPFHVKISSDLFDYLQCLRVLDLSDTCIEELPISIGNLIHLRYLGLRNTKIKRLPESICCLFKLQTLDLRLCHDLEDLPKAKDLFPNLHVEMHVASPSQHSSKIDPSLAAQTVPVIEIHTNATVYESQTGNMLNLTGDLQISYGGSKVDGRKAEENYLIKEFEIASELIQF